MNRKVKTCLIVALFVLLAREVPGVMAVTPSAQAASEDNALQLLAIELFFLLIGLFVIAVLGYLIWESLQKKREKEKHEKK
jgi:heme/copper-type cytochrome/quinol oxidase subunit 2